MDEFKDSEELTFCEYFAEYDNCTFEETSCFAKIEFAGEVFEGECEELIAQFGGNTTDGNCTEQKEGPFSCADDL